MSNFIRSNRVLFFLFFLVFLIGCGNNKESTKKVTAKNDLDKIKKKNKLVAVTDYNSTSYFIYRGTPMGYQYELLTRLADHMGVKLEVLTNNDLEKNFEWLQEGRCDLIAVNLTITKERSEEVSFSVPHTQTRQVLVQRKPTGWKKLSQQEINIGVIRNQLDLAGKTVYVQKNSSFASRLYHLSEEIGDSINIVEVPMETEHLIRLVAKGEIDYTVSDENVAKVNKTYYPNLDIQTAISFPQYLAWAVRKDSKELLKEINNWLVDYKKTTEYHVIYNKYFNTRKSMKRRVSSDYFSLHSSKISPYDELLKKYSDIYVVL